MAKKTRLKGFNQGAKQVVDFFKGEIISESEYQKNVRKI